MGVSVAGNTFIVSFRFSLYTCIETLCVTQRPFYVSFPPSSLSPSPHPSLNNCSPLVSDKHKNSLLSLQALYCWSG